MAEKKQVLIIIDAPLNETQTSSFSNKISKESVACLCFYEKDDSPLIERWRYYRWTDFYNPDSFRTDFLDFLNRWPEKKNKKNASFNDCFKTTDGYSLWWLGPGVDRHPDKDVFAIMRSIWVINNAIEAIKPIKIFLKTDFKPVEIALEKRCKEIGCTYQSLSIAIKNPKKDTGIWFWLIITCIKSFLVPCQFLSNAVINKRAIKEKKSNGDSAIVLTTHFPRHLVKSAFGHEVWFWKAIEESIKTTFPENKFYYLMQVNPSDCNQILFPGIYKANLEGAQNIRNAVFPIQEIVPCIENIKAILCQLKMAIKYAFLENQMGKEARFLFCGMDVGLLYRVLLRKIIGQAAGWECIIAAKTSALKKLGRIKCMLVADEMYPSGMQDIIAAKRLGIPTIGVQHGTIFPMHTIYTLPPDQIVHAPIPDYFAAYGEYSKEVLCKIGNYPGERVLMTGAPRMDHLVTSPISTRNAREQLDLPLNKKIILMTTQKYPWFITATRMVFSSCIKRQDVMICVKTHPIDYPAVEYQKEIPPDMAHRVRCFDKSIELLLAACDLLVSWTSTTMLEALLLNKQIISIDLSGLPEKYPYVSQGGALPAYDERSLSEAITQALRNDKESELTINKFKKRHLGPTSNGEGSEVFVKALTDLHLLKS